jgi:predicted amidohydrolase YtcJ
VTGRLVAGLSADLVVIDADPYADGPEVLLTARPLLTVVAGEVGHAAPGW